MCLEALENIMLVCGTTHKYEGSGMNGTNDNTTKEPTEDHLSRRQLPRDILMLEQEENGSYCPTYLWYYLHVLCDCSCMRRILCSITGDYHQEGTNFKMLPGQPLW